MHDCGGNAATGAFLSGNCNSRRSRLDAGDVMTSGAERDKVAPRSATHDQNSIGRLDKAIDDHRFPPKKTAIDVGIKRVEIPPRYLGIRSNVAHL